MSAVIFEFPENNDRAKVTRLMSEPASVIIMPVVRIERHPDDPDNSPGRRRRRRNVSADICGND